MINSLWIPGVYHGRGKKNVFFEGWYYKLISANLHRRLAVIPGVFHHPEPDLNHAFIQVLDGMTSQVVYHRYPYHAFQASRNTFDIRVGNSSFRHQDVQLDIEGEDQVIKGEVTFDGIQPWPVNLFSPGVMGPYRFVPFMQTYHGILSLDHRIQGSLMINQDTIDLTGGRGYIEKDWGSTFPRAYIWMQSNHFANHQGVSLTASVATIPWLTGWFRGFLIGLLVDGKLYRFTTYLGSEIKYLQVSDHLVNWVTTGTRKTDPDGLFPGYELSIRADRGQAGLLSSPEMDGMRPRIFESLTASIEVSLKGLDGSGNSAKDIFQGTGSCGGLEVAGSIHEITDLHPEKI
jgi:tocopherol cyclase